MADDKRKEGESSEDEFEGFFEEPEGYFKEHQPGHATFVRGNGKNIELNLVAQHSLWAHCLWNAARFLADHLDSAERCKDLSFLELGAGSGLPSIMAALNGASRVLITDYPEDVLLDNIKENVRSNCGTVSHVKVMGHMWGKEPEKLIESSGGQFDRIILSDLIFNHLSHRDMLRTCKTCLKPGGKVLVAFSHHRPNFTKEDLNFFTVAREEFSFECNLERSMRMKAMFPEDPGPEDVRATVHYYILQ
ncbi:hypothetical protein PROFUN_06129 [Planoprotostelium fungivorum]|uniref:Uncharacterized protein n=1 Tax=Planoprotostelium fungivorum TaxID=1890364 RepID=A0A2P6NPH4_9EUKA|nr:hypothetical protein PROFUN_06129 [Planoprotostelium fungivorum]